ncbi:hypothetical protein VNI00_007772 [Paramarasmius palmivorus]|uniref:Uncharacterized protein n=1 Tax=Paramarasmius palmivorus TaxID=297713 RepID=A0AAW0CYE8_9AGAR
MSAGQEQGEEREQEHSLGTTTAPPPKLVPESGAHNQYDLVVESENVIAQEPSQVESGETEPPGPSDPLQLPPMPSPSDIVLHSPSSQIIGTPFATDTPKFEYPFPESSLSNDSIPSSTSSTSSSSLSLQIQSPPLIAPPPPREGASRSQSPTHPKMMKNVIPPVPPSLISKAKNKSQTHRWSMGLLSRRAARSQSHSQSDTEGASGSGEVAELKRRFSAGARTPPEAYWTPLEAPTGSALYDGDGSQTA